MKKLTFILLMAVLALPMMGQTKTYGLQAVRTSTKPVTTKVQTLIPQFATTTVRVDIPEGYCAITLNAADVWQDGTGYQMLLDADANTYGTVIPETGGLTTSGDASAATYAEFEYKIPENADGALTTTNIVLDDEVTILIPAGVYDWCITNPTPGDRLWIASANGTIPGRYDDYEFVAGSTYIFYVTLGGSNDRVDLEIIDPNAPVLPVNVTADPDATTADVAWDNDHDVAWNLRYRVYNPNAAQTLTWGAEDNEDLDGWISYDNDGDGNSWGVSAYDDAHGGSNIFWSFSYYSYTSYDPDNWLISPEVGLGGTLSFWAASYASYYPDNFAVFVTTGDPEDLDSYVMISDFITAPDDWTEYTFDLSDYAGETGHFAIRHYDSYDNYYLFVDDITLEVPGEELAEWIYVEGITDTNYTIEGLDPETTYEVQVQSVGVDGRTSDWTQSTLFTTEEAGQQPTETCLAPNTGYEITGFEEATVTITNREPGATIVYEVYCDGELVETGSFTDDVYSFNVTGAGNYVIHAIATMQGKNDSPDGGCFFTILENEGPTGISELVNGKQIANVRYFNALGQEMQSVNGMTIVVTTYTDGTTSTAKVVK